MKSEKIAIAVSKDERGKLTIQVLGINGDRVISSVPDLEETGIGFATASRVVERLWTTIKLRLNRQQLEFLTKDKGQNDDERNGADID